MQCRARQVSSAHVPVEKLYHCSAEKTTVCARGKVRVRATYLPELGLVFAQTVENAKKSRFRLNLPEIDKVALGAFK